MANEDAYNSTATNNFATQDSLGNVTGVAAQGRDSSPADRKGAIRFTGVAVAQGTTVNYASVQFYVQYTGGGGGTLKSKVYGIDEDNTGELTGDPWGRTHTTAVTYRSDTEPSTGTYVEFIVTDQVNEIVARAGWVSGNAMGFLIEDNGTTDTSPPTWMSDEATGNTYLLIRLSAEPNFTPTPGSVVSPTFSVGSNYGIKISKSGINVRTATETQIYFTTKKNQLKMLKQKEVSLALGGNNFAHGLPYVPSVLGYIKSGTDRYKLNKSTTGVPEYLASNAQNVIISSANAGSTGYYYVFIDPLT